MQNRRNVLAAALAAPAAAALSDGAQAAIPTEASPAPAVTQDEAIRILLGNVREPFEAVQQKVVEMVARLNLKLMQRNPDLFDPRYVMHGPVAIIEDQTVLAKTRRYEARYTYTADGDDLGPHATASEMREAIEDALVRDFELEIRGALASAPAGTQFCPYQPVSSSGVILDPETFEPVVSFNTRYGTFQRT